MIVLLLLSAVLGGVAGALAVGWVLPAAKRSWKKTVRRARAALVSYALKGLSPAEAREILVGVKPAAVDPGLVSCPADPASFREFNEVKEIAETQTEIKEAA